MINLLPQVEKKAIKAEYRLRVAAFSLLMVSMVAALTLVTLVPSVYFVMTRVKIAEAEQILASESVDQEMISNLRSQVIALNDDIALLGKATPFHMTIEHVVGQVVAERTDQVEIDQIFYAVRDEVIRLELRGTARDRDALSDFSQLLEANPWFYRVTVPVSNYIEPDNLEYAIVLEVVTEPVS